MKHSFTLLILLNTIFILETYGNLIHFINDDIFHEIKKKATSWEPINPENNPLSWLSND